MPEKIKDSDDNNTPQGVQTEDIEGLHEEVCSLIKDLETNVKKQIEELETKSRPSEKLAEEIKEQKDNLASFKVEIEELRRMRRSNPADQEELPSIAEEMRENSEVRSFLERGFHKGHIVYNLKNLQLNERKTTISSSTVGSATSGIIRPTRTRDYVPAAEQRLRLRDILPSRPVDSNAVEFPQEDTFTNAASPQVEAQDKAESALTFTIGTANIRTIAHWIPASAQVLDDWPQLRRIIDAKMMYGLKLKEEAELLTGSGTGQHLNGVQTQATAFETGRIKANDTILDFLRHAFSQVEENNELSDFCVLHTSDFWEMLGLKDQASNNGAYIFGNPANLMSVQTVWGKMVVVSNSQTADTFLVGDSSMVDVLDRQQAAIVISTEHSDYFIKNLIAIRVEERIGLAVYRTGAFVTGSLATASPL